MSPSIHIIINYGNDGSRDSIFGGNVWKMVRK
jgi:hypothetical protein